MYGAPYSTTVDSVADIPASSDNYITGYTIEFLRDITGTEETPDRLCYHI